MSGDASNVHAAVKEWRTFVDLKTEKSKRNDELLTEVNKKRKEQKGLVAAWEEQRLTTEHTIDAVMEQVDAKRRELAAMEKETLTLSDKIQERQKKIDDNSRIIHVRGDDADRKLRAMLEKEAQVKIRIKEFREARDVAQTKLKKTIDSIEAAIPRELEEHQRRIAALGAKAEEIEQRILLEAKQWEVECASREYESLHAAHQSLEIELKHSTDAKLMWSETLQALSHQSNRSAGISNELAQLRRLITTD